MENTGFKGLLVTIFQRVILSYKTTLIGLALAIAGQVIEFYVNSPNKVVATVFGGLGILFALVKERLKAKGVTGGKVGVAIVLGMLAFGASAQEAPRFGGCLNDKALTCFGPSLSLSLVSVDLDTGDILTTFVPGVGYGVTLFTNRWYETGLSGFVNIRDTDEGQRMVGSGVVSFAKYLRVGVGHQFGSNQKPLLLLGVGTDLGSVPSSQ